MLNQGVLPKMNMMADATDKPNIPKIDKSLPKTPINLPPAPFFKYPTAYKILEIITTKPRTAEAIGKYIPEMNNQTKVVGANST